MLYLCSVLQRLQKMPPLTTWSYKKQKRLAEELLPIIQIEKKKKIVCSYHNFHFWGRVNDIIDNC